MYAVVEDRGKQYKVESGAEFMVDHLDLAPGSTVELERVLLVRSASRGVAVGKPTVAGAKVLARVIAQEKGVKTVSYKLRRRKDSRTKRGHRALLTRIRVTKIEEPSDWS
ncbi:MAG: 50S ribosomal protein L21 [Planctomycetota bacterium]|jgi:large subunit ribosomal protein L21